MQTETFSVLALCQWFNVLNCRSETRSAFGSSLLENPWLMVGLVASLSLQGADVFYRPLGEVFHTVPFDLATAGAIIAVASLVLWVEGTSLVWIEDTRWGARLIGVITQERMRSTIVLLVTVLLLVRVAHADGVDTLVKQLWDSSEKVRLAAAVNLAKAGAERGILPLANSVLNDRDKNVRGAAAVGLGKLLSAHPDSKYKNVAVANLKKAAASDGSDFVRSQANNALKTIGTGTAAAARARPAAARAAST